MLAFSGCHLFTNTSCIDAIRASIDYDNVAAQQFIRKTQNCLFCPSPRGPQGTIRASNPEESEKNILVREADTVEE
jgi:hypothetical protein